MYGTRPPSTAWDECANLTSQRREPTGQLVPPRIQPPAVSQVRTGPAEGCVVHAAVGCEVTPGQEHREHGHAASDTPNHGTSGYLRTIEVNIPAPYAHREGRRSRVRVKPRPFGRCHDMPRWYYM